MKKILIIDSNVSYLLNNMNKTTGGAAVQTFNWICGFDNLGYNVIILSENKIPVNKSKYKIINDYDFNNKNFISSFLSALVFYYRTFKSLSPDYIYCSIPWWNRILYILPAKIIGIKFIQRISNDNLVKKDSLHIFNNRIKNFLFRISLNLSKNIICQNDYQYNSLIKRFPNKNIQKLYNPFKFHNIDYLSSKQYVAWVGLFQKQKNLPELLKIALSLPKVNFMIAGKEISNGSLDSLTHSTLIKLKNLNNVKFVGNLDRREIFSFLSNSFCLLNTSHEEGFSNTYLEAFSVGIPVVTRKKTDPDNIISTFNLGISVNTYELIPQAILDILSNNVNYKKRMTDYLACYHDPTNLSKQLINQAI